MFFLSWLTARGSGTGSVCFRMDTDSPVRMDWSTLKVVERMEVSRMSAGTLSPTGEKQVLKKEGLVSFFFYQARYAIRTMYAVKALKM